jgi:hypothetical protein
VCSFAYTQLYGVSAADSYRIPLLFLLQQNTREQKIRRSVTGAVLRVSALGIENEIQDPQNERVPLSGVTSRISMEFAKESALKLKVSARRGERIDGIRCVLSPR